MMQAHVAGDTGPCRYPGRDFEDGASVRPMRMKRCRFPWLKRTRVPESLLLVLIAATPALVLGQASAQEPQIRIVTPRTADDPESVGRIQVLVRAGDGPVVAVTAFVDGIPLESLAGPPYRWDMPPRASDSTVSVRVTARDEHGHQASEEVLVGGANEVPLFHSDSQAVTLNIGVFDSWKRRILDLQRHEVIVRDNGRPQEILGFGRENIPLRALVLLDHSGSMDGRMEMARQALDQLLSRLDARDQLKLVAFNDHINQLVDFTQDRDVIRASAASLEAGGGTALYDAILLALQSFETATVSPTRPAMVILSDGWDQDSVNPMSRVIDRVREVGATIFAVGHGEALESDELRATLREIARSTGGEAFFVPRADHLSPIFAQIARRMRAMYFVSFISDIRSSGWHELTVEVPERRRLTLLHKLGYVAVGDDGGR